MRFSKRIRITTDILNRPWMWIGFSVSMLMMDYIVGPFVQFPITYIIPVSLAAWHRGLKWAVPMAVILPLIRFAYTFVWPVPWGIADALINLIIRILVLLSFAFLVSRTARQTLELEREVKVLQGILPICGHCKKIRDQSGGWTQLETFISRKSEAQFSHTVCP